VRFSGGREKKGGVDRGKEEKHLRKAIEERRADLEDPSSPVGKSSRLGMGVKKEPKRGKSKVVGREVAKCEKGERK